MPKPMSTRACTSTLVAALRVYQWPKNLVVFAALLFGRQLFHPEQVLRSVAAFAILCLASSGVYLFNDTMDAARDRLHPTKRFRPIASGALGRGMALALCAVLVAGSLAAAFTLRVAFGAVITFYIAMMSTYTLVLKRIFLVDVLTVASGFVVRAVAGAVVLGVIFTNWLVVCAFFLALFLSLCKRRRELDLVQEAPEHREVFGLYSATYLDGLILLTAGTTLLNYVIYTCSPEVLERFGTDKLYLTVPFVAYGLFRYLFLVHHRLSGEDPSRTFLEDGPLVSAILLWGCACVTIIYGAPAFR